MRIEHFFWGIQQVMKRQNILHDKKGYYCKSARGSGGMLSLEILRLSCYEITTGNVYFSICFCLLKVFKEGM